MRLISWTDAQEPALPADLELPPFDPLRGSRPVGTRLGEWVTTDATGRLESRIELPDARIRFVTYEFFSVEADHRVGADGRGVELRLVVAAGPIVLLDFEPLEGYARTDYIATLRRDGDRHPAYINELPSPLDPHAGQRGGGNAAPVRAEPAPWVRIPYRAADDPMPNYFVLESRDRRHFGSVLVEELERYALEPLRVELATREVLDLRIEWPPAAGNGPDLTLLDVSFTRLEALAEDPLAEPEVETFVSRVMLEAQTRTWLPGLSPGWFRLVAGVKVQDHEPRARPIVIERTVAIPGEGPLRIAPRLAPPLALHRVELTVRTASGNSLEGFEGRAALSGFYSAQPPGYSERLQWSAGTARTALVDLPAGPVQLQADWSTGWFPTEPEVLAFEVPHGPLEILVRDDVPTERLVLRVLEPAERGELWYKIGAGFPAIHRLERIRPEAAIRLPDGRRVFEHASERYATDLAIQSIKLTMEGHENLWLGPADIPPADSEGRRMVELVPRRGWNMRVKVVQGADDAARPQPGIALAFDGIETLASDPHGVLLHRADAQPERVAVVTPGWELVQRTSYSGEGTVQGDSGRFTIEDGELTIEVRPTGR